MGNFKLKQMFKKKGIILTFLIVRSIFLFEKAFPEWGKDCCFVNYLVATPIFKENRIKIYFKFIEYNPKPDQRSFFLENFEAEYSTDGGRSYIHLMSAFTDNQEKKKWAWITIKDKRKGERISLYTQPADHTETFELKWKDGINPKIIVSNHPKKQNQSWLCVHWYPNENQNKITHVRITALWNKSGTSPSERFNIVYPIYYGSNANVKTNNTIFTNLSTKQEIRTEVGCPVSCSNFSLLFLMF